MPYEPDFRNMPIPEEIEPPVVKYEPINRSEIMKENRLLERSNTSSNLQKFSPRPFLVSDSSFSVLPNEDKSESLYKYNYENELWNKDDSKDLKMFNYHFGYKPPIMNKRADPNLSVSQSEDLEMQRYNPHSGSVEKYTIPKALPDSFDLPRINKSMHTFGKSEFMNKNYFRNQAFSAKSSNK